MPTAKLSDQSGATQQGSARDECHEDNIQRWEESLQHRALQTAVTVPPGQSCGEEEKKSLYLMGISL
jgi:hypothetical protein